ncbi:MAG: hypothetical protein HN742_10475 [Lentisphaerae bacterium]|nr:hypothetical protein [Lentisphaerota bacterium]MBT4814842.1 hypothetical protein [Lentisphaerota bacterium]MBT5610986.1 hypothetical protein [Lentisphaerota bacterium]MBT7062332.1 hypothetical protein [Lentisphaerota bacterium]MBT7842289.1 hypothetical protein [Lentisphaerota bacterium]
MLADVAEPPPQKGALGVGDNYVGLGKRIKDASPELYATECTVDDWPDGRTRSTDTIRVPVAAGK